MILSYGYKPIMPCFCIDKANDLYLFSVSNIFSNLFHYFNSAMDKILLSGFLANNIMGYFNLASELAFQLLHEMIMPFARGLFPIFSHISSKKEILEQEYSKIFCFLMIILPAMTLGLFLISEDFILLYAGKEWEPAIIYFKMLIISNGLYVFILLQGVIFSATGYENTRRKLLFFQMIISYLLLLPFALQKDIISMLLARIGLLCGIMLLYFYYIKKYYHITWKKYGSFFCALFLSNCVMFFVHNTIIAYGIFPKIILLSVSFFLSLFLCWRGFLEFIHLFLSTIEYFKI